MYAYDNINWWIGQREKSLLVANFSFCQGQMFFYTRQVNVDSDYAPLLRTLLERYGQPKIESKEVSGAEKHFFYQVQMRWMDRDDEIELNLTPQKLDEKGGFIASRSASLSYESPKVKHACWP